ALVDLAMLLARPAEPATELARPHLQPDLTGQDESLIGAQRVRGPLDRAQIETEHRALLDVGASVDDLDFSMARAAERERSVEHRLRRAAPPEGTATVSDARDEAQLEHVVQVRPAREPQLAATRLGHKLDGRLAVAVLQVLPAQPWAVHRQQQPARGVCDQRDFLGGVK